MDFLEKWLVRFMGGRSRYPTNALRVVDLNYVFNILVGVAEIQERLCKLADWSESYHVKVKLLNCWRTIPFVDVPDALDKIAEHGLPMCMDSIVAFPRAIGPENYIEISRYPEIENNVTRVLMQAVQMFHPIALTYGIPAWIPYENDDQGTSYLVALQEAGRQALEVQQRRQQRSTR